MTLKAPITDDIKKIAKKRSFTFYLQNHIEKNSQINSIIERVPTVIGKTEVYKVSPSTPSEAMNENILDFSNYTETVQGKETKEYDFTNARIAVQTKYDPTAEDADSIDHIKNLSEKVAERFAKIDNKLIINAIKGYDAKGRDLISEFNQTRVNLTLNTTNKEQLEKSITTLSAEIKTACRDSGISSANGIVICCHHSHYSNIVNMLNSANNNLTAINNNNLNEFRYKDILFAEAPDLYEKSDNEEKDEEIKNQFFYFPRSKIIKMVYYGNPSKDSGAEKLGQIDSRIYSALSITADKTAGRDDEIQNTYILRTQAINIAPTTSGKGTFISK